MMNYMSYTGLLMQMLNLMQMAIGETVWKIEKSWSIDMRIEELQMEYFLLLMSLQLPDALDKKRNLLKSMTV